MTSDADRCAPSPQHAERGIAIIAVLVVLAILLALATQFLLSMGHGDRAARALIGEKRTAWAAASARDLLLGEAAKSAWAIDETPLYDSLDEFPDRVTFPDAFADIEENGRVSYGGEVWDLQRKIDLNTASPLVLANLLGLSARVSSDLAEDFTEIPVENASGFPDTGYVVINREIIGYGERDDSTFRDLERGVLVAAGFQPGLEYEMSEGTLVLDLRTVLATIYPFFGRNASSQRRPYASVAELTQIEQIFQLGGFSIEELEVLDAHCAIGAINENATTWGKPERVFDILLDTLQRPTTLRVRSAADIGGGSVVRIRSTDGNLVEHALVYATHVPQGERGIVTLGSNWFLNLLTPLTLPFVPMDTVVERLVPVPVNVNTADETVLAALFENLRRRPRSMSHGGQREGSEPPPIMRRNQAFDLASRIVALRSNPDDLGAAVVDLAGAEVGPFRNWEDFATRAMRPMIQAESSRDRRMLWLLAYDNAQNGRPGAADMGTMPLSFHSGSIVAYRAAALRSNPLRGAETARLERQGIAVAAPGLELPWVVATQAQMEEMFRLDRRVPQWLTYPINTSAVNPRDRGTDPSVRTNAHLLSFAFPDAGFGQPRFPDDDGTEGALQPAPSTTPFAYDDDWYDHETYSLSNHPEGRDLEAEGYYEIENSGPRSVANQGATASGRHDRIRHPLTHAEGLPSRTAIGFWFRLTDTGPQALYELSVGEEGQPERNRISLQLRDDMLVLEVFDEAGVDPEPSAIDTTVPRTTGVWEVPVADVNLQQDVWYHASLSAFGNQPNQLTLLIDNIPHGQAKLRTYLTAPIPAFQYNQQAPPGTNEAQLQLPIRVESTEGFPPRGVIKIGTELFEYTSVDATTFHLRRDDSMGGRLARQAVNEFVDPIPASGVLSGENLLRIMQGTRQAWSPDHAAGSAVELYGYALAVYPGRILDAGEMRLTEGIGAFTIARAVNQRNSGADPVIVQVQLGVGGGGRPIDIEIGLGITDTFDDDILLADPFSQELPAAAASQPILDGFNASGGYALLVQQPFNFNGNGTSTSVPTGGIEVIRYTSRDRDRLTGIQRGITFDNVPGVEWADDEDGFSPSTPIRQFVTEYTNLIPANPDPGQPDNFNEMPRYYTYVVPISVSVTGAIPAQSNTVEWAQILPSGDETDTEWLRYNTIVENRFLVRAEQRAWDNLLRVLSTGRGRISVDVANGGGSNLQTDEVAPYPTPSDPRPNEIGYIDQVEIDFPAVHIARMNLGFRGDAFTNTSAHAHNVSDKVLPVHRFEFDWARYGALAPRPGRNDRIALVQGSARRSGQVPGLDWQTINWSRLHYDADGLNGQTVTGRAVPSGIEDRGASPFALVAFKEGLREVFVGDAQQTRELRMDSRLLDRAVKFPSGELPACDPASARVGDSPYGEAPPMRGIADEVYALARRVTPRVLESPLSETGNQFFIRDDVVITPLGPLHNAQPREWPNYGNAAQFSPEGGLILIGDELIAYERYDQATSQITVAADGRGVLGTTPRNHTAAELVYFVDQVPTGILASGLGERDDEIVLQSLGGLPRTGGTVLIGGTELAHYTWSSAGTSLGMPRWNHPDEQGTRPEGLFRGRYGTDAVSAAVGAPIIWMPFRYWDRYRPRSDDPESSYAQFTFEPGPAYFVGFGWEEEGQSALVNLQCFARVDGRGSFADDAAQVPGLYQFRNGGDVDRLNQIGLLGSRLEARFVVEYSSGCFDAQTFRAHDWKFAPRVKFFAATYEAEGRVLHERITAR